MDLYLSPQGNDRWSGLLPEPAADGRDGPLATFAGVRNRLRVLRTGLFNPSWGRADTPLDGSVTVHARGGVYPVDAPVQFGPEDSYPLTFRAWPGEEPILDGGVRITDWEETRINGKTAWSADLPQVRDGSWQFRQLFVNGVRALRPRFPKEGLFRMEAAPGMPEHAGWGQGGYTQFVAAAGDVDRFSRLDDVEVVYVHFWIEERSPIASFCRDTRTVTMARPSCAPLVGSHGSQLADYYLDNVVEALTEPGEWYLDRAAGKLLYLPRPGEIPDNTEVWAPRCLQLLALCGDPEAHRFVEHLRFEGITFRHTDWRHPDEATQPLYGSWRLRPNAPGDRAYGRHYSRGGHAAASQAASDLPGVVVFEGARHCGLVSCKVEHVGWYAVDIGDACEHLEVRHSTLRDLGAGGVKINGAAAREADAALRRTGRCRVTDNEITAGGRVFHSAVGVLSMNAFQMAIVHNHIHDLFYTGVSCGWEWGYQENASRDNLIGWNHIHHLGQGLLSDMGGIYTLGVQPGTVLRNNLIHDVRSAHYGGWCIYPDEGSSHLLIEHNVCHDADRNAFHQHYGRENVIRNNVFAFGGEAVCTYSQHEPHRGFTFVRNILVTDGKPLWNRARHNDQVGLALERERLIADLNLVWDTSGAAPSVESGGKRYPFTAWQEAGLDAHSLCADPRFIDLAARDLSLAADSPAWALGFEPIDLSRVGPRSS
jgi:hypothetical protein